MSKLIDWFWYRFFDNRPVGYMSDSKGEGKRLWMFARCSSLADGHLPAVRLPKEVADECHLADINPREIPVWWMEQKLIRGVMSRLEGMDIVDLVPESTKGFENKMAIRANMREGVLVYVSSKGSSVFVKSPNDWLLEGVVFGRAVSGDFNSKLRTDGFMINIPLKDPSVLKVFLRNFDQICNGLAKNIVELDKK